MNIECISLEVFLIFSPYFFSRKLCNVILAVHKEFVMPYKAKGELYLSFMIIGWVYYFYFLLKQQFIF